MDKAPDAFRTISEVAEDLDLPQHVLRFWETRFSQIKPLKRGGGRRYYRPDDIDLLRGIRHLLYGEGYTIKGVQRIFKDEGVKFVQAVWKEGAPAPRSRPETDAASQAEPRETLVASAPPQPGPVQPIHAPPMRRAEALQPPPPAMAAHPLQPIAAAGSVTDIRRLQAVLYELDECRRVLAAARQGGEAA